MQKDFEMQKNKFPICIYFKCIFSVSISSVCDYIKLSKKYHRAEYSYLYVIDLTAELVSGQTLHQND